MKKFLIALLSLVLCSSAFAQGEHEIQALSQAFSSYLVNHVTIHLKGVRFLETTARLSRGLTFQMTVVLNKNGKIEDVIVNRGINEIFDGDFRDIIFLMPKEDLQQLTSNLIIPDEKNYIPVILDIKMTACDRKLADKIEDEYTSKRWKRFDLEDPELIRQFPKLAEYKPIKDKCYSSVWYIYYRLMNLRITVGDPSLNVPEEQKVPVSAESEE